MKTITNSDGKKTAKKEEQKLLDGFTSASTIANELGWQVSKVEKFCRALEVPYITGSKGYIIKVDHFKNKFECWVQQRYPYNDGASVNQLEELRLYMLRQKKAKSERARERAAQKKRES